MSTQIKMTIQSEGKRSTIAPPLLLIPFHEKRKCNESKNTRAYGCVSACVCMCMHAIISACSESEVVFGMRGDNLEV